MNKMLANELKEKIMDVLNKRGPMTYKEIASAVWEDAERVKRACASLKREWKVCINMTDIHGCVGTAMVIPVADGTMIGVKAKGALDGAYAKGQMNLHGETVLWTFKDLVIYKESGQWKQNATE